MTNFLPQVWLLFGTIALAAAWGLAVIVSSELRRLRDLHDHKVRVAQLRILYDRSRGSEGVLVV